MGCCNAKEKKAKPTRSAEKPATQVIEVKVNGPSQADQEQLRKVDEVKQGSCLRLSKVIEARKSLFRYDKCPVENGETTKMFTDGLFFRIVRDGTCYFYNDTLHYEMHLHCAFPPGSEFAPAEQTTVSQIADGWSDMSIIVYPLETVEFGSGPMEVFKTDATAMPLSDEYRSRIEQLTCEAAEELKRVQDLARGSNDEESTLRKCIENGAPFVDEKFAPSPAMLSRPGVDCRNIPLTQFRRPRESLDVECDAVRGSVIPQCIDRGLLGDTWFACAMAILAEDEERVRAMFAQTTGDEKSLGAYRVEVNKGGWWRSVIVDDFLPSINSVPCFARVIDDPAELWASLLQKAYAKLHGSYAAITGGDALHALQDFSGVPVFRFDKEWNEAAANGGQEAADLLEQLVKYSADGQTIVLSTAATDASGRCAAAGLYSGFTYRVETVQQMPEANVTLFKIQNPWESSATWEGRWSAGSPSWNQNPKLKELCMPAGAVSMKSEDGSFWADWEEAKTHFNGGGVVFTQYGNALYDYRVQGDFHYVVPSVVLIVHAVEAVEVVLTLAQRDKRGVAVTDPDARFSPLMISVSRSDGNKQRVECSSTSNPEISSDKFKFVVAREVSMKYRFEPSAEPYFVIPRIQRKGTSEGRQKEYVVGIQSSQPLDGKLDVQFTKLESDCPVFKNRISFVVENTTEVIRAFQKKKPGEAAVTDTGSKIAEADYVTINETEQPEMGEQQHNEENAETDAKAANAASSAEHENVDNNATHDSEDDINDAAQPEHEQRDEEEAEDEEANLIQQKQDSMKINGHAEQNVVTVN